jgi:signal transduction histidine kinase
LKLFYKISIIIFIFLSISFGIFYYFLSKTISRDTLSKISETIEVNFIKTVDSIKKEKLYEDPKNMIKKISMLEENQSFLEGLFILDNDNSIIFSSDISLINKKISDFYQNIKFSKNKFSDDKHFYVINKLTKDKKVIGVYKIEIATHVITHLNSVFLRYIIVFIIIFFFVIFIIINLFLIKPIKNLETSTLKLSSGDFNAKVDIIRNDELGNLANQFNKMLSSLNKVMSEKNTLLRVLSHDLTNQIGSSSSLLKNTLESSEYLEKSDLLEYISYIDNDLDNAQKLIDFTKKFIALESGKIELDLKDDDIEKIINDSISTFKNKASDKNIKIILKKDEDKYFSRIDSTVFRYSIIDNLLSNAIKFSPPNNDVFIDISKKEGHILIKFLNNGEHIPKEKINKLFSLTEKTTSLGTKGEKGTGFGLPIVYKFIKLMNAEIKIESNKMENNKIENIFIVILKGE